MFLTTFCARTGTAPHTGHVEELSEEHFVSKRDEQANKELTGESRRSVGISRSPFDPPLKLLSQARPPRLRKASFKPYALFLIVLGLSSGLDFLDGCLLFASQRSSAASIMPTDPRFATTFRARLI